MSASTSTLSSQHEPRQLLAYFDVAPLAKLITPPAAAVVTQQKQPTKSSSSTLAPPTPAGIAPDSSSSPSPAPSRRSSLSSAPPSTPSATSPASPSSQQQARYHPSSRHGLSRLSDARVIQSPLILRVLPPNPFSPRCTSPPRSTSDGKKEKQEKEKQEKISSTEASLLQRLQSISQLNTSSPVPPKLHDLSIAANTTAADQDMTHAAPVLSYHEKGIVREVRKRCGMGRLTAREAARIDIPHAPSASHSISLLHDSTAAIDYEAVRGVRKLEDIDVLRNSSVMNDGDRWTSPYSKPPTIVIGDIDPSAAASDPSLLLLSSLHPLITSSRSFLSSLTTSTACSPELCHTSFRSGVRSILLTAKNERSYQASVMLLAEACTQMPVRERRRSDSAGGSPFPGNNNAVSSSHYINLSSSTLLYPFLKLWTSSLLRRKLIRKAELKRQLDTLAHHSYYSLPAFSSIRDYKLWLKNTALSIHKQLLEVSAQIDDLREQEKKRMKILKSTGRLLSKCVCLGGDNATANGAAGTEEDDEEDDETEATLAASPFSAANSMNGTAGVPNGAVVVGAMPSSTSFSHQPPQYEPLLGFTEMKHPPQPIPKRIRFGIKPNTNGMNGNGASSSSPLPLSASAQKARDLRKRERRLRNEIRAKRRSAAGNPTRKPSSSMRTSPSSATNTNGGVSSDSPSTASSDDDTNWIRTPAEEQQRQEHLSLIKSRREQHLMYAEQLRRKKDAEAILKDIGLTSEKIQDARQHAMMNGDGNGSTSTPRVTPRLTPMPAGGTNLTTPTTYGMSLQPPGSTTNSEHTPSAVGQPQLALQYQQQHQQHSDSAHSLYMHLLYCFLTLSPDTNALQAQADAIEAEEKRKREGGAPLNNNHLAVQQIRKDSNSTTTMDQLTSMLSPTALVSGAMSGVSKLTNFMGVGGGGGKDQQQMTPSKTGVGQDSTNGATSSSTTTAPLTPRQQLYTHSSLNPSFNPLLSPSSRTILDSYGKFYNIELIYRYLCYFEILVYNRQRTWSYWASVLNTIVILERLKKGISRGGKDGKDSSSSATSSFAPTWTLNESSLYITLLEQLFQWCMHCLTYSQSVFECKLDYRDKEQHRLWKLKKEKEEEEKRMKEKETHASAKSKLKGLTTTIKASAKMLHNSIANGSTVNVHHNGKTNGEIDNLTTPKHAKRASGSQQNSRKSKKSTNDDDASDEEVEGEGDDDADGGEDGDGQGKNQAQEDARDAALAQAAHQSAAGIASPSFARVGSHTRPTAGGGAPSAAALPPDAYDPLNTNHPLLPGPVQLDISESSLRCCLDVAHKCWKILDRVARETVAMHLAAQQPGAAVLPVVIPTHTPSSQMSLSAPVPSSSSLLLHNYLTPLITQAFTKIYEDMSHAIEQLTKEQKGSWKHGRDGDDEEKKESNEKKIVLRIGSTSIDDQSSSNSTSTTTTATTLTSSTQFSLLLHTLLLEVTYHSRFNEKHLRHMKFLPYQTWITTVKQTLFDLFWKDCEMWVKQERIPRIMDLRAEVEDMRSNPDTTVQVATASLKAEKTRDMNQQIAEVFEIYTGLMYFLNGVFGLPQVQVVSGVATTVGGGGVTVSGTSPAVTMVALSTSPGYPSSVPTGSLGSASTTSNSINNNILINPLILEYQHSLKHWFTTLSDGYLDAVLDQMDEVFAELQAHAGQGDAGGDTKTLMSMAPASPTRASQTLIVRGSATSSSGTTTPATLTPSPSIIPPNSLVSHLLDLFQLCDTYLLRVVNKPLTFTHKRNLLDGMARIMKCVAEERVMASSHLDTNATSITDPFSIGLTEELHIRHSLNQIYIGLYPALATLTEKEREKQVKKMAEEVAQRKANTTAVSSPSSPPSTSIHHTFGYDTPTLPSLTRTSIYKLNCLRIINTKLDTMYTRLLNLTSGIGELEHRGAEAHGVQNLLVQSMAFLAHDLCEVLLPNTIFNLLSNSASTSGSGGQGASSTRWSTAKIEKCLSELLGFFYAHIEYFKKERMHIDLLRELGMFLLVEITEAFMLEMKNYERYTDSGSGSGVFYYRKRDIEQTLSKDQLLRVQEALKLLKEFVVDVCYVKVEWWESAFPGSGNTGGANNTSSGSGSGNGSTKSASLNLPSFAQLLGLGPYGPKTIEMYVSTNVSSGLQTIAEGGIGSSSSSSITSSNSPSTAPPFTIPPPSPNYTSPSSWSSIPFLLCEIWRCEKLLQILLAPSLIVQQLFETYQPSSIERKTLREILLEKNQPYAAVLLDRLEKRTAEKKEAAASMSSNAPPSSMVTPAVSKSTSFAVNDGSSSSSSGTVDHALLHIDINPPSASSLSLSASPSTIPSIASSSSASLAHSPSDLHPSVVASSPSSSLSFPVTTITNLPHPYSVCGISRYIIYRSLQYRAKFHDDSSAAEFIKRTKKPEKLKEPTPPSVLTKLFK